MRDLETLYSYKISGIEKGKYLGISGKQKVSKIEPKLPVLSSKYIIKFHNLGNPEE